jgi:trigger factor
MQVSVENTSGLERRLTVQLPGQEIQDKINAKLRELSKTVRIKGFRPGRVPMSIVKQRYGQQATADIQNEAIQTGLQQAIQDENLRPASMPRLEAEPANNDEGDLEFVALVEVYPEIDTLDVSTMSIERPEAEVSEEDVDDMISTLREQRIEWSEVEREIKKGDKVLVEYVAKTEEGRVPAEGKQQLSIIMGDSSFEDMEKAIKKLSAGDKTKVELIFPEGFRDPGLAGKKADAKLKVLTVEKGTKPKVDKEFIKSFGIEDGKKESFHIEIRNNLERELKQATSTLLKANLIEQLIKATPDMEVPEAVVRQEASTMAAQMVQSQGQELPPEMMAKLVEPFMEQAEGRVRAGLLLGELAHQNEIRIDANRVREAIEQAASTYEEPAEVVQLYYNNERLMQQVESSVLEEQVVDWVLENAKVSPQEVKFQDVITAATAKAQA